MKVRMAIEQSNIDSFLDRVISKYHFSRENKEMLRNVYEKIRVSMSPYASYRLNQRMRGVRDIDDNQTALVAMTLGDGIDKLQAHFEKQHALEESYMLDCISNELLLHMYTEFNRAYPRFHRRYVKRYVFVGTDIPLTDMELLLDEIRGSNQKKRVKDSLDEADEMLKKDRNDGKNTKMDFKEEVAEELCDKGAIIRKENKRNQEIHANEYGVLTPSKSVVFFAVLSDNPSQLCEGICMNCGNVNCENRMQAGNQGSMKMEIKDPLEDAKTENLSYGFQKIFGTEH